MNKKIVAAVAVAALTLGGGLLSATTAFAEEASPDTTSQEVASSPDSTASPETTSPTTPGLDSSSPSTESAPTEATPETASPATEEVVTTPSGTPSAPSEDVSTSTQKVASSTGTDVTEWNTFLINAPGTFPTGHVSLGKDAFTPRQTFLAAGQVQPACNQYAQQDNATGTRAAIDGVIAAGIGWNDNAGHADDNDLAGYKINDWTIVYGGDCPPAVQQQCTSDTSGGTSTNLDADGWVNYDTRSAGNAEYVEGGLHIWTTDNSSEAKVSWAKGASFPLSDTGTFGVDWDGSVPPPGINLFVNFGADGSGTLVYEGVYGQDLWLSNGSSAAVKANAPSHTGGNGSDNHGTINEWLAKYPDAQVTGVAFSLGSGVLGDGVLHSISTGCGSYAFDYEELVVPEQPEPIVTHDSSDVVDCDTSIVTIHHTTTTTDYAYDETTNTWIAQEPVTTNDEDTTRPATDEECPAVVTPPTTTPAPEVPASDVPPAAAISLSEDDTLAHTGSDLAPLGLIGGLLALTGLSLFGAVKLRNRKS